MKQWSRLGIIGGISLLFVCYLVRLYAMEITGSWVNKMTLASQVLIKSLQSSIKLPDIAQDIEDKDVRAFAADMRSIVKQVQGISVEALGILRPLVVADILSTIRAIKPDSFLEFDTQSWGFRNSILSTGRDALYSDPVITRRALKIIFYDNEAMKAFIDSIKSFVDRDYLSQLMNDEKTKQYAQKLFNARKIKMSPKFPEYFVSDISVAFAMGILQFASLDVLKSVEKQFGVLAAYKLRVSDALRLWYAYKNIEAATRVMPEAVPALLSRAVEGLQAHVLFAMTSSKQPLPMDVVVMGTSVPKQFPGRSNAVFSIGHVNSAEYRPEIATLFIFRAEEALKTVLHEIYHRVGLQLNKAAKEHHEWLEQYVAVTHMLGDTILFNESLVEAAACISNVIMTAANSATSDEEFWVLLSEMWQMEKAFSLYQAAKVLTLSGFERFEDFLNTIGTSKVREYTAAAEYHVLKTALLYQLPQFIWIIKTRTELDEPIQNLLVSVCNDAVFRTTMNQYMKYVMDTNTASALFKTGRMTLIEQEIGLKVNEL